MVGSRPVVTANRREKLPPPDDASTRQVTESLSALFATACRFRQRKAPRLPPKARLRQQNRRPGGGQGRYPAPEDVSRACAHSPDAAAGTAACAIVARQRLALVARHSCGGQGRRATAGKRRAGRTPRRTVAPLDAPQCRQCPPGTHATEARPSTVPARPPAERKSTPNVPRTEKIRQGLRDERRTLSPLGPCRPMRACRGRQLPPGTLSPHSGSATRPTEAIKTWLRYQTP